VTTTTTQTTLDAARHYLRSGWAIVPVPRGQKNPVLPAWPKLHITEQELPNYVPAESNLGILCGTPSQDLIDIDCDAPEAVGAAATFLPPTDRVHGRPGKRSSHYWYRVTAPVKTRKFQFVEHGKTEATMLVELRSTGCQTIVPPSIHPSGERLAWEADLDPASTAPDVLERGAARVAACALLARNWPGTGSRDEAALALCGMLLRGGWTATETDEFVQKAAWIAGDEEWRDRAKAAHTQQTLQSGMPVTGAPVLATLLRDGERVVAQLRAWLVLSNPHHESTAAAQDGEVETATESAGTGRRGPSVAAQLLALADNASYFHDGEQTGWATMPVGDHHETWPIRSRTFQLWLARQLYQASSKTANPQAVSEASAVLESRARFDGPLLPVCTRLAEHQGALYLDLANDDWQAVKITGAGWEIVRDLPVRFRRPGGMLALPQPTHGGSLDLLRPFVNVEGDTLGGASDWKLLVAWLLAALRPTGPFPVLVLSGEMGSAKSTLARVLRALVDPNSAPLRAEPRDMRDLAITAKNSWVMVLDNLSGLSTWHSDALCRLSTGGGAAYRTLYENDAETIFQAQRPVILTGIEEVATRGDLVDRAILLALPPVADDRRRPESVFWRDFERAQPAILGALSTVVAGALRDLPAIPPPDLPRMADFALWIAAAEPTLGWKPRSFERAYAINRRGANTLALETSPVAEHLIALMDGRQVWDGTPTEALHALTAQAGERVTQLPTWPKTPRGLSGALKRVAPNLRRAGLEVQMYQRGDAKHSRAYRIQTVAVQPSEPSDVHALRGATG
jgi:hypothetical protein